MLLSRVIKRLFWARRIRGCGWERLLPTTQRSVTIRWLIVASLLLFRVPSAHLALSPPEGPLLRAIDVNVGESQEVELWDGQKVKVKLLHLKENRDELCSAVRRARVEVEVNGETVTLTSATYHLPRTVRSIQIDCPITKGYLEASETDAWGLVKDARLRLWPAGSPWTVSGTFTYPVQQQWFASATQMANEPVFVDGGDVPGIRKIYYHYGLDIGGSEGSVDVIAATEGVVVSSGNQLLPGSQDTPVQPRYDVIYLRDSQGWYYRYSHLKTIDPAVRVGQTVKMGQKLGVLGKEGGSGGWSHLHFDITSRQPSGKWGIQEGYAFLWEAYHRQHASKLVAVARPHLLAWVGQKVLLDATRSWSATGKIARYEWTFTDGSTAVGPQVERSYDRPGSYSEVLKVVDSDGQVDYDFAVVQVLEKEQPQKLPPTIHANYAPTFGIKPNDPVTFKVRTFRTTDGSERWDFGDSTPPVMVKSDGNVKPLAPDGYAQIIHRYTQPGHYLVRVERSNRQGSKAVAHLHVRVGYETQGNK
jgi:murein DD-endopeptidase MepM/ murein hydrolase activator NlpD